jgi:hypothetical protein
MLLPLGTFALGAVLRLEGNFATAREFEACVKPLVVASFVRFAGVRRLRSRNGSLAAALSLATVSFRCFLALVTDVVNVRLKPHGFDAVPMAGE